MASPLVLIDGYTQLNGINVVAGSEVLIALLSTTGVTTWDVTCIGTDDLNTTTVINNNLIINQATKTATFTAPSTNGAALIFNSIINNGLDINGISDPNLSTTFGVYVLTSSNFRVGAQNETIEGNATYGWLTKFNQLVRNL